MEIFAWARQRAGQHRAAQAHAPGPLRQRDEHLAADADAPTFGCGWFDSSHELRAGLAVIEHEVIDVVAASLRPAWRRSAAA